MKGREFMEQNTNLRNDIPRRGIKKLVFSIVALAIAAAVVVGIVFATSGNSAYAAPWSSTTQVTFTDDSGGTADSKWPKKYVGDDNAKVVAFCINENQDANPKDFPRRFYLEENAKDADGIPYISSAVIENISGGNPLGYNQTETLKRLFRRALAYGYVGKDPLGLFPGFSDGKLYEVTQAAIYQIAHFGANGIDNLPNDPDHLFSNTFKPSHSSWSDVKKLLEVAYEGGTNYPDPSGELYLFVSMVKNDKGGMSYAGGQNLIGGDFSVTPAVEINTTVSVERYGSASTDNPLEIQLAEGETKLEGVTVVDTVKYDKLPSGNYNIRMDIVNSSGESVAGRDGNFNVDGSKTVDLGQTTKWGVTLEPGTYAVNIKITTADGTKTYEHNGLQDKSEQIIVKAYDAPVSNPAIVSTTAKAGGKTASDSAPAEVTIAQGETLVIADDIKVSGLAENVNYTVEAKLWSKGSVQQTKTETITSANDTVTVTFDAVTPEDGQQYNVSARLLEGNTEKASHNADRRTVSERVIVTVTPEERDVVGTAKIELIKKVKKQDGSEISAEEFAEKYANKFSFKIEAVEAIVEGTAIPKEDIPLPDDIIVKNDAQGKISFGDISYSKEGTYKYMVTEIKPTDSGELVSEIEYDTKPEYVTVKVTKSVSNKQ